MKIEVIDKDGNQKAVCSGEQQAVLGWKGSYEPGDQILFQVPAADTFYKIRIDDTMDEELVFLTRPEISYVIPFAEKKASYNPKSFSGDNHCITLRTADESEVLAYRNLAKNVLDQHGDTGCYPHASANVETRGESVFAARNAIDGILANAYHGEWPYSSWGINQQADAAMLLEFGRPVDTDRLVLITRADFPHDSWWTEATVICSDGSTVTFSMEKSDQPHSFEFVKKGITWLRLEQLIKAPDESPFPALTQIEVYGC